MAENRKASTRLRPVIHAYLLELAKAGAYGKGKAGVIRHFVEVGIVAALQGGVIHRLDVRDHGETVTDDDDDQDADL